ncbi:MAG: hypothetical protein A3C80_01695 [Candidatus Ryanbacteria bacterium RIFCSPHIGHO2_02_FULL_45_43]|uniref:Uncharacterized protein n=1 Tax=Candidatus Ryanbacteria bacterium RIFCSPHIGHO2_01_45_13 TaxID=1802112 RepID=A0A1G2FXZ8_9BACT|nr:MAG: hypothetical protein A2718_02530 [Candidatus Ryanbacteria bacterium RIFCSPHIGHO2_01_FULL_44_130]OGZ42955.1 MAG: hypothetical protein A2W41_02470 [Candidatus Ryanbacteria bacterium RIFCSPHIGHO2_01_45_13]OGZ48660.1 MAG: hypothetical protein A3C80_01695 [Candidatus Ryanbacteria bacterium RIFCSPHIGHO2_02_FULL_45_43]OGZ50600.1 MAG: hypothetical protein A3E55_03175 [Candidatus Ryanbacteria bacterium RIFCSPHIGHO2_12_FULL_44_20]OGZ51906.1 MAG: hypothetical protein A3A17_00550 [Candidatus Ryanba
METQHRVLPFLQWTAGFLFGGLLLWYIVPEIISRAPINDIINRVALFLIPTFHLPLLPSLPAALLLAVLEIPIAIIGPILIYFALRKEWYHFSHGFLVGIFFFGITYYATLVWFGSIFVNY